MAGPEQAKIDLQKKYFLNPSFLAIVHQAMGREEIVATLPLAVSDRVKNFVEAFGSRLLAVTANKNTVFIYIFDPDCQAVFSFEYDLKGASPSLRLLRAVTTQNQLLGNKISPRRN